MISTPEMSGRVNRLHEALVRVLETHGVAGATALSGITATARIAVSHRKGLIGAPRRPILLVIENEAKLRAVLPTLDRWSPKGATPSDQSGHPTLLIVANMTNRRRFSQRDKPTAHVRQ